MNKIKKNVIAFSLILGAAFSLVSCGENSKKDKEIITVNQESNIQKPDVPITDNAEIAKMKDPLLASYIQLKNALVADDNEEAERAGGNLLVALKAFDTSKYSPEEQKKLKDIIADAQEQAEHISESPIHHQREHFSTLSQDMDDLLAITGTKETLYKDFCPMYNNGKGGIWLSETKTIKNPYFGSKMMDCGSVRKKF